MLLFKRFFARIFAFFVVNKIKSSYSKAPEIQKKTLKRLIEKAKKTTFGIDHNFNEIKNHEDFIKRVPVRDYEQIKKYIDRIKNGELDVLWPGKPKYLAKTSGTTSGVKQIPITIESMPNHILSARNSLLFYIYETGKTNFLNGKTIFIQGSPVLNNTNGILEGRLSGIVAYHVPSYLRKNNLPTLKTNSIEDWELKVDRICDETVNQKMSVIGGIPSWVKMYFEKILEKTEKKSIAELFNEFTLYIHGGVNFLPYKNIFKDLIGKQIDTIEYYPASEGFFAYQNSQFDMSLLLQYDSGIYFEFIKANEFDSENPRRYDLSSVKTETNYVLIISNNAGLWAYNTGDTVKFTSLNPPKILVTGRYKHFISAFGEHVISEEVEKSISELCQIKKINIREFTVAPMINPQKGLPYHEWWIEFENENIDINSAEKILDKNMQQKNIYYKDLVKGGVLKSLKIVVVKKEGFNEYMKSIGKLGGQNKVPKLSNNRVFVNGLKSFVIH
ncbi:MAG: hypothetical protein CMP33_00015 [Rickettsiales bacterium]|nr:hypothetical protein [Rickettsiales bacterium]